MSNHRSQLVISQGELTSLKLNPKNARIHSDKQVRQIAKSIEAFGFNVPILVDKNLNVIAGHGRVLAARLLEWDQVPMIRLEHLTEHQQRAFLLADNKLCENARWNERLLGEQLQILADAELDFSMDVIGFETSEIDLLIEGACTLDATDSDPADVLSECTGPNVTQLGDVWQLGRHRVACANSLETESYKLMVGKKARVVVADPPYNVRIDGHASGLGKTHHREFPMASGEMSSEEFSVFLRNAMRVVAANSMDGAISFYFMDFRHISEILAAGKEVYSSFINLCVWAKDNAGMGSFYRSGHELIFVFKNGNGKHQNNIQLGKYGRYRTNVWKYPSANSFSRSSSEGDLLALHPTVKPVALVSDAILDCSSLGDTVLDPFLGSGTTLIASEKAGRKCFGIELDPQYVDIAVRRWQKFTGQTAIHAVTGESFDNERLQCCERSDFRC